MSNQITVQRVYAHDGLGRGVEAKEGSSVTFYSYRGAETLSDQFTSGTSNDYVYADGLRIARTGTYVSTYYYHTDAVGSTRLVTDANRNIAFSDNYQPFGQDNSSSGSETYKFTGKPVSQTTGWYYDYQRWYDPSIGRFVNQDPLGGDLSNPQSQNRYVYANNIPTTFTDPTGLAIYANLHPSCPSIFQDFWGSLRCGILGPAPVAGLTGGLGGVGPSVTSPTPAGAIIVAAVSLYWLYANWDSIRGFSGRWNRLSLRHHLVGKYPRHYLRLQTPL